MSNEREDIEMNIKKLRELKKNKKGFTLIEIIVVIVILAVLMAVAVPSVLKYLNEADDAKYMAQGRSIMTTAEAEAVKAFSADRMIDGDELDMLKAPATYNANGMGTVSDVNLYSAGTVSELKGVVTISSATPYAADSAAATNMKEIKIVTAKIDGKYIIAVPNGKIYVTSTAPSVNP